MHNFVRAALFCFFLNGASTAALRNTLCFLSAKPFPSAVIYDRRIRGRVLLFFTYGSKPIIQNLWFKTNGSKICLLFKVEFLRSGSLSTALSFRQFLVLRMTKKRKQTQKSGQKAEWQRLSCESAKLARLGRE